MRSQHHWNENDDVGGRYRLLKRLAQGGYGEVYLANDERLDRNVAIKVPRTSWLEEPDFAERYRREIRAMAELEHPHVVNVFDVDEHEGRPFMVMEYLSGGSLAERISQASASPVERLAKWLPQIAAALDYVHANGYVHRDVKPSNILFDTHGHAYLTDFGVAKVVANLSKRGAGQSLTRAGVGLGTPAYMAPEQCGSGAAIDGRADQYALAVLVYETLAGQPPLQGDSEFATIGLQLTKIPEPLVKRAPRVPVALANAVDRALRKKPEERFKNCAAFASSVMSALAAPAAVPPVPVGRAGHTVGTSDEGQTPWAEGARTQMPPPRVPCPACGKMLRRPAANLKGQRVQCPGCRVAVLWDGVALKSAATTETPAAADQDTRRSASQGGGRSQPPPFVFPPVAEPALELALDSGAHSMKSERWLAGRRLWIASGAGLALGIAIVWGIWMLFGGGPPDLFDATRPRSAREAREAQRAWAEYLGVPVEEVVSLGDGISMTFVLIPPGKFLMGSEEGIGDDDESPQVEVTLTEPFYLASMEVTQGQWRAVMDTIPWEDNSKTRSGISYAANQINWDDARDFCDALNQGSAEYRLLSEAEWEYACRAGTLKKYFFGDDELLLDNYAWFEENAEQIGAEHAQVVADKEPNAFGLFDMHGNVWEWCDDWYDETYYVSLGGHAVNPSGAPTGTTRIVRGGSWDSVAERCRSAFRLMGDPEVRFNDVGFRVALVLPKK